MAQGRELKAVISIAGALDPSLGKAINDATKGASGLSAAFKAAGAIGAAGFAALSSAAVAGTKALFDLGMQFDSASDAIRIGTGATGEALRALEGDFDVVYGSVPAAMEDAASAIADYNTRLGLTGEPLQELSKQALQVNNLLGDDLSSVIEESSQAFRQWGIDAKDMGDAMDYVFKASQSTGVGFTSLLSSAQQFGPQMQELGFSFKEAVALFGQLDKAGVNASEVMGALKKSVGGMAKDGISAAEGLRQYTERIRDAGSATEAVAIASEVFGSKAGSTMAEAIRSGALSVSDLVAELDAAAETIEVCAAATEDFPEKLQKLSQSAQVAFRPLAEGVVDVANGAMPYLQQAFEAVIPALQGAAEAFLPVLQGLTDGLMQGVGAAAEAVAPVAEGFLSGIASSLPGIAAGFKKAWAAASPFLAAIGGKAAESLARIGQALSPIGDALADVLSAAFDSVGIGALLPILDELAGAAFPAVAAAAEALAPAVSGMLPVLSQVMGAVAAMAPYATSAIREISGALSAALLPVVQAVGDGVAALSPVLASVIGAVGEVLSALHPLYEMALPAAISIMGDAASWITSIVVPAVGALSDAVVALTPVITSAVEVATAVLTGVLAFLTDVFRGNWEAAWQDIRNIFGTVWGALSGIVQEAFNAVIGMINAAIRQINSIQVTVPDWVPGIGGETFSLDVPEIPMLARGGFTEGPSVAGEAGQEAVISFDPAFRRENLAYWAKAGKMLGVQEAAAAEAAATAPAASGGVSLSYSPSVTIQGNADYDAVLQALRDNEEELLDLLEELLESRRAAAYG